jgi:predicted small metal-binding protein
MPKDATEKRKTIDCRLYPSEKNCSLAISGTEEEVLTVAVRHAVQEHGHQDTPELRQQLKELLKEA